MTLSGTTFTGVSVTLTTTTDNNGDYLFANLLPGDYEISYPVLDDYLEITSRAGTIESMVTGQGSYEDASVPTTQIRSISLGEGEHGVDYDFMLLQGDVEVQIDCTPEQVYRGEEVSCTVTYTNHSSQPADDVTISTQIPTDTALKAYPDFCVEGSLNCF